MRALVFPLSFLVVACAAGSGDDVPEPPVVTSGAFHHYAQRSFTLSSDIAEPLGLDLDGDDIVDNQVGNTILVLESFFGVDAQSTIDEALGAGSLVILHSVRSDALTLDDSVSWRVMAGAPTEAPPRWDGTDTFQFAGDDGSLVGTIDRRGARMEQGVVSVPLPFFPDQPPMILPLANAQIRATIDDTGCEGVLAGIILADDIDNTVRRFAVEAVADIERHPEHGFAPTLNGYFDDNGNGVITVEEIVNAEVTEQLFRPHIDTDGDRQPDALSFGVGFSCEAAQFVAPGESDL